jgi:hypothetical protein
MNNAERIYKQLQVEKAGIWYISDDYGSKIMAKLPTPTIKALTKGCEIKFLFGRNNALQPNVFHIGLKIYDDLVHPQMIYGVHRYKDEHLSLGKILQIETVQIQFVNELNIIQAFGEVIFSDRSKQDILSLLNNPKELYIGDFTATINGSLDIFQDSFLHLSIPPTDFHLLEVSEKVINWSFNKTYLYTESSVVDMDIKGNEGAELEKEVFTVISSIFKQNTFKSPTIPFKSTSRELTDIFAFSDLGIFLLETKALSVFNAAEDRTMDRKVANLQKQVSKAISQLVGAIKKIKENTPILDENKNEILFNRSLVPHGIVLVSEMLVFGEWEHTIGQMMKAMIETNSMIHVMDMKEFMQFVGNANDSMYQFDHFLVQRAQKFAEHPAIFVETRFLPGKNE